MAAANLALSIKHFNVDIDICIITDSIANLKKVVGFRADYFNHIVEEPGLLKKDPAFHKLSIYNLIEQHSPFENNLYVDVDSICLKDLTPLIETLSSGKDDYLALVSASYTLKKGIDMPEMMWGKSDNIRKHFGLKETSVLPATNSSFQFIRKSETAKKIFDTALEYYENPMPLTLKEQWAKGQPDELYLNVSLAKHKLIPSIENVMIAPAKGMKIIEVSELRKLYYFITFFGNRLKAPPKYITWYDAELSAMNKLNGVGHYFKLHNIFQTKLVQ